MEWYRKGFHDELYCTTSVESDYEIENKAYKLGAMDAVVGDDMPSLDYRSEEEILKEIKSFYTGQSE